MESGKWNVERAKSLEAYLASKDLDPTCKAVVEDLRNATIFKLATAIYAEGKWKEGLVQLRDLTGATWPEIKKAWPFVDMNKNGTRYIRKFEWWHKAERSLNYFMSFLLVLMATSVFLIATGQNPSINSRVAVLQMLLAVVLLMAAVWCAAQNAPMIMAKKLDKKLQSNSGLASDTLAVSPAATPANPVSPLGDAPEATDATTTTTQWSMENCGNPSFGESGK